MSSQPFPFDIELHNVAAPEPAPNGPGWLLPRFPRAAYETFESPGFLTGQESTGVELRFVCDAPHLRVYVSAPNCPCEVAVFKGDLQCATQAIPAGAVQCVHLTPPERFSSVHPGALGGMFHPDVWRVVLDKGAMIFHGIDTFGYPLRAPLASEKPAVRWLAYGSSITHSSRHGYAHRAAQLLGVDVQNKGQSGSCFIDDAAVEFLTDGCEWDLATLELGINMRFRHALEDFQPRARNIVTKCVAAKPGHPVFLITIFRNAADHLVVPDEFAAKQRAFNHVLRELAQEFQDQNIHLIEGTDIVRDLTYLTSDLVHPSDSGHMRMGMHLAGILAPAVEALKKRGM